MNAPHYIGKILGIDPISLERIDKVMTERTGRRDVLQRVMQSNEAHIEKALRALGSEDHDGVSVRGLLKTAIFRHEKQLMNFVDIVEGESEFDKAAKLAKKIAKAGRGFFLKRDYAEEILRKRNPENLLKYLKLGSVGEVLEKHDVLEAFSALRFVESNEWMHETFEEAYSAFTSADFEERDIEIKVLGPEWQEIAQKFVAKKHHNVSHLKEFGVIFINPIKEDVSGKFLRDFALLLHYFHEIEFYSKLFRKYAAEPDFAERFKALLRGDVKEVKRTQEGEWLIVQRYLFKENPDDPRLLMPRVNPESMHWFRGERDLALASGAGAELDMALWHNLDWVGSFFNGDKELVSFDLEDNAMSAVSSSEGVSSYFTYHQREAMWTKLFSEYVGGEEAMERLLIEHFDQGIIAF